MPSTNTVRKRTTDNQRDEGLNSIQQIFMGDYEQMRQNARGHMKVKDLTA